MSVSDGRRLRFALAPNRRTVRVVGVDAGTTATVAIRAIGPDGRTGPAASATLARAVKLSRLKWLAPRRANRPAVLRVRVSTRTVLKGVLSTIPKKGTKARTVRRFQASGGPGTVVLRFIGPKKAGRYLVRIRAGSAGRSVKVAFGK